MPTPLSASISTRAKVSFVENRFFGPLANADARTVIVSFKGTNPASLKNWLANLDFSVVPYDASVPGAMVHEGAH